MTDEERVQLEIEMKACLITADQMGKNDRCMDVNIMRLCNELRDKAENIRKMLQSNI